MNSELEEAMAAFAHWRDHRTARSPIPKGLWEMACRVAQKIGIQQTSHHLRVNATRLKQHISSSINIEQSEKVTFQELKVAPPKTTIQNEVCLEIQGKQRVVKMTLKNLDEAHLLRWIQILGDQP
jgi:hypothetical protein